MRAGKTYLLVGRVGEGGGGKRVEGRKEGRKEEGEKIYLAFLPTTIFRFFFSTSGSSTRNIFHLRIFIYSLKNTKDDVS